MSGERPKVGLGIAIRKDGKILLGQRKSDHAKDTWCCPGGHLEQGESLIECALRETAEECGLTISTPVFGCVTNDIFADGRHYITICMVADWISGEPQVLEPNKMISWGWFKWNELPEPIMLPTVNAKLQGFDPFKVAA